LRTADGWTRRIGADHGHTGAHSTLALLSKQSEGRLAQDNGGEPGEALISLSSDDRERVHFREVAADNGHPKRTEPQRGEDVIAIVIVLLGMAKLGGFARVVLPTGRAFEVKVPAGVPNGAQLRLRGLGQPGLNGGEPGDALVSIEVEPNGAGRATSISS
jgi:DnaJ C terminal domain